METNVYINGREACSRASDGKSAGAFPDPCWSPPPPPTGPVVVPYSNTAYARDLQNGTATVFICKSMVAQKDRSYFSTSEGNVPATPGFQKGHGGNDSNLLIVFYVQIMPDDFVMQLHRF
ncbi:PAAR-like domain-containing protein [Escherichia coli]